MKLIIGLGNPDRKYSKTRHNTGLMLVDVLVKRKLPSDLIAKKSDVFMNESGNFVFEAVEKYSLPTNDLYIIHDDLDIPLGEYKIQQGKGPKDHNGLKDIYQKLGTKDFWHVRVGVDNRNPENRIDGMTYVLQDFTKKEKETLNGVIKEICKKLATL